MIRNRDLGPLNPDIIAMCIPAAHAAVDRAMRTPMERLVDDLSAKVAAMFEEQEQPDE